MRLKNIAILGITTLVVLLGYQNCGKFDLNKKGLSSTSPNSTSSSDRAPNPIIPLNGSFFASISSVDSRNVTTNQADQMAVYLLLGLGDGKFIETLTAPASCKPVGAVQLTEAVKKTCSNDIINLLKADANKDLKDDLFKNFLIKVASAVSLYQFGGPARTNNTLTGTTPSNVPWAGIPRESIQDANSFTVLTIARFLLGGGEWNVSNLTGTAATAAETKIPAELAQVCAKKSGAARSDERACADALADLIFSTGYQGNPAATAFQLTNLYIRAVTASWSDYLSGAAKGARVECSASQDKIMGQVSLWGPSSIPADAVGDPQTIALSINLANIASVLKCDITVLGRTYKDVSSSIANICLTSAAQSNNGNICTRAVFGAQSIDSCMNPGATPRNQFDFEVTANGRTLNLGATQPSPPPEPQPSRAPAPAGPNYSNASQAITTCERILLGIYSVSQPGAPSNFELGFASAIHNPGTYEVKAYEDCLSEKTRNLVPPKDTQGIEIKKEYDEKLLAATNLCITATLKTCTANPAAPGCVATLRPCAMDKNSEKFKTECKDAPKPEGQKLADANATQTAIQNNCHFGNGTSSGSECSSALAQQSSNCEGVDSDGSRTTVSGACHNEMPVITVNCGSVEQGGTGWNAAQMEGAVMNVNGTNSVIDCAGYPPPAPPR